MQLDHPAQLLECFVDVADAQTLPCVVGHPPFPLPLHLLLWRQVLVVVVATVTNDEDEQEKGKRKRGMRVGEEEEEGEDLRTKAQFMFRCVEAHLNTNLQLMLDVFDLYEMSH